MGLATIIHPFGDHHFWKPRCWSWHVLTIMGIRLVPPESWRHTQRRPRPRCCDVSWRPRWWGWHWMASLLRFNHQKWSFHQEKPWENEPPEMVHVMATAAKSWLKQQHTCYSIGKTWDFASITTRIHHFNGKTSGCWTVHPQKKW